MLEFLYRIRCFGLKQLLAHIYFNYDAEASERDTQIEIRIFPQFKFFQDILFLKSFLSNSRIRLMVCGRFLPPFLPQRHQKEKKRIAWDRICKLRMPGTNLLWTKSRRDTQESHIEFIHQLPVDGEMEDDQNDCSKQSQRQLLKINTTCPTGRHLGLAKVFN